MKFPKGSRILIISYIFFQLGVFTSCEKEKDQHNCATHLVHELSSKYCASIPNNIKHYFFSGHIYGSPSTIDTRLACMNYNCYDQIWLGGDLCAETTLNYETINYLDHIFDLSSPTTHWALGNHDIRNGNISWITEKTQRPTFYTANFNGITLMVLNTNFLHAAINDTASVNRQFDMIQSVCDTIQNSSHLIILSHHQMWYQVQGVSHVNVAANMNFSNFLVRLSPNQNYAQAIYPLLQQVASKGVKVINVAGDFGQYKANFEATTADGIEFIGSGITAQIPWSKQFPTHGYHDKVLIFHHDLTTKAISWTFDFL